MGGKVEFVLIIIYNDIILDLETIHTLIFKLNALQDSTSQTWSSYLLAPQTPP